jgi:hypothetical protein
MTGISHSVDNLSGRSLLIERNLIARTTATITNGNRVVSQL